jgi:hypothetical protein
MDALPEAAHNGGVDTTPPGAITAVITSMAGITTVSIPYQSGLH